MPYRPKLSAPMREQVWVRWKRGETLEEMGRALDRHFSTLYDYLSRHGGIPPRPRSRSVRALSLAEREEISRGLAAGCSVRQIASRMGRAASTVSREVSRNGGPDRYRAADAEASALKRARRPKVCRLVGNTRLRDAVVAKLGLDWSPEQISGWLREAFPTEPDMQLSTETIYQSLFVQARGALKKELRRHLRTGQMLRRPKQPIPVKGRIPDALSIRQRPAEAEDRAVPGHWEGDLLYGSKNSHIATLVERHSRYLMLVKVDGRDTTSVIQGLVREVRKLPTHLRRSLTWDRGTEMAHHAKFTVATDVSVYFCDPQSPWQRGSNENTNGLLRQYFPKGMDLSGHTQAHLNKIALRLNQRPRKTLGFKTPADKLGETLR